MFLCQLHLSYMVRLSINNIVETLTGGMCCCVKSCTNGFLTLAVYDYCRAPSQGKGFSRTQHNKS